MIYNAVLVSDILQSGLVYIYTLILFPYGPLQSIERCSLYNAVGAYWLSILYTVISICQPQASNLSLLPCLLPGNHKFVTSISVL